jgi:hypothetical protein
MKDVSGYDFVPEWVSVLIEKGVLLSGGGTRVKTPLEMGGLQVISVGLCSKIFADNVEELARKNGYLPITYRQWDNGPGGTIVFCEKDDKHLWDRFYRK